MVRRLFISLLILSALTAEGMVKLSGSICKYLDMEEVLASVEPEAQNNDGLEHWKNKAGLFFDASKQEALGIDAKVLPVFYVYVLNMPAIYTLNHHESCSFSVVCSYCPPVGDDDRIYSKNDLSPPYSI